MSVQLIEGVVDGIVDLLQSDLKDQLQAVQEQMPLGPDDPVLEPVAPNHYYVSERFIGLQTPAIFVLPMISTHRLDAAQNYAYIENRVQVVILIEEIGDLLADRLARKSWRYVMALWKTLHDQVLTTPYPATNLLVETIKYSPLILAKREAQQVFRKEAWLDVLATSTEDFS